MRVLCVTILLMTICFGQAQTLDPQPDKTAQELYDFHIKKKRANNTVGWITLGSGVVMVVGGLGWNLSGGILDGDTTNNNKGLWLSYLGGAVTLISIPLFISAGGHKRKANIQLSQGAVGFNNEFIFSGLKFTYKF